MSYMTSDFDAPHTQKTYKFILKKPAMNLSLKCKENY